MSREAALRRRCQLFLPADRPERAARAASSGADAVVLDLEDAVVPAKRPGARDGLAALVAGVRGADAAPTVVVRVNGDALADDVPAAVAAGADEVMVPKVESAAQVREVEELVDEAERAAGREPGGVGLQLLLESPRGLLAAAEVAAAGRRTVAMALGVEDLAAELEVDPSSPEADLRWAHGMLLCAARAHGLAPYGLLGSITNFRDLPGLAADARRSRAFGYVGSLVIHPAQVEVVREGFAPSSAEVDHARAVLAAAERAGREGSGATQVDGLMVDAPVVDRARRLLARAGEDG